MILAKEEEEEEVIIRGVRSTADSSLSLSLDAVFFLFSGEPSELRGWI